MIVYIKRLFVVIIAVLTCVGVWGCGDTSYMEFEGRRGGYLVAFVNDSLALMRTMNRYNVCENVGGFSGTENCYNGYDDVGLHLVNYKEKKPALWGDTINYYVNIKDGFYHDSVVFLYYNNEFGFWKIGQKEKFGRGVEWVLPCSGAGDAFFRPWKNGNVLLMGAEGCEHSVLDTSSGKISELKDETLSWIKGCDDVTCMNNHILCLKSVYAENRYGVVLEVDGLRKDSLIWYGSKWLSKSTKNVQIRGDKFLLDHPAWSLSGYANDLAGIKIYSLNALGFVETKFGISDAVASYTIFLDSLGNSIEYRISDLFPLR